MVYVMRYTCTIRSVLPFRKSLSNCFRYQAHVITIQYSVALSVSEKSSVHFDAESTCISLSPEVISPLLLYCNVSSNGCHYGPIFFKPEKNLEFFRQKIGP